MVTVSVMTATLVSALLYFSGIGNRDAAQNSIPTPSEKQVNVPVDTSRQVIEPDPLPPQPFLHPRLSSQVPRADSFAGLPTASDSLVAPVREEESLFFSESPVYSGLDTTKLPVATGMGNDAGSWESMNDSLLVDTVFNGVKALVFKGRVNEKIVVHGSNRTNVAMHFNYKYKVKGIFTRKNNECAVSYEKKDSVLNIQIDRNNPVNIGVSYSKETSGLSFEVPENIAVQIKTSFGDIDVSGLKNNDFDFQTSYGDIKASVVSGNINLKSSYGDITAEQLNGKIDINTGYGDVDGKNITVSEQLNIKSGYGDIDFQIMNPIADCVLDFKTGFGKVKIKRTDFELEAASKLIFGKGNIKIIAKSGYGDVIIR
jgi:hypothetical protein